MTWEHFISYSHLMELGIAIGIFLLFILFRKLFTKYVFRIVMRIVRKTKINALSNIFLAFQKPMEWFFTLLGFYFAISYYPYIHGSVLNKFISAAFIVLVTWGLVSLSSSSSNLFRKINEKTDINIDEILIPLLSRTLQFIIVAIAATIILQQFGYSIEGLIAGLGLGGLAISLAAKDALANFLGGIVIISEKPFTIGDWILTPSVEGTVEDISFRSTKIRTFADALVSVPNNQLANESITNWSKMNKRRITFNLSLDYETSREKMESIIQRIENLLKNHPDIHQETIFVRFDEYKESSLDILLYFFTKTTVWGEYLKVKEEINYQILDIVREEGAEFAYPTRKLYIENDSSDDSEHLLQVRQES
ncbi:mechanosensitive ion channel family protein [Bacilli bacterium]|uniref:mechanosensitive ion channel family protein n=1 Tax=Oceanobacillus TaxID=182709 RepID=UPI000621E2A8|nr:mechanosensitive ion channel family protein [Oceanobacillus caeni]KKE79911.1 mechanosensitive ion channel protein [Bacilli bacterium VT-13-104]PZD84094.1 mechanosensitive ion channel family protein [Bacilli bacterium]MBU8792297.1 mechanosensitive ion channel family protein [Oceanobacillus caeni]PZD85455.1 mechanosensitive ion channel family protein [Bacilli bacterium]PZD88229.1 mechanosensitive ion channel family protein [Bacilli bacterium]